MTKGPRKGPRVELDELLTGINGRSGLYKVVVKVTIHR